MLVFWILCALVRAQDIDSGMGGDDGSDQSVTDQVAGVAEDVVANTRTIRLIYTGNLGGVGSGQYRFPTYVAAESVLTQMSETVDQATVFHGTLAQGDWLVTTADRSVSSVVSFVQDEEISCGQPQPIDVWVSNHDIVESSSSELLQQLSSRTGGQRVNFVGFDCVCQQGIQARLVGPSDTDLPDWELTSFEFLLGMDALFSDGTRLTVTGRPIQEGSRVFSAIRDLTQEDESAVYLDAGSFVDGVSSVREGGLSLHRDLGYAMLDRLAPTVLVPGATELVGGADQFFEDIHETYLPYIATNWTAEEPGQQLPRSAIITVDSPLGAVRIAFVGILDPILNRTVPKLEADGVSITDPVIDVQHVVDGLRDGTDPPDAVIAVTTAGADALSSMRTRLKGVDLLIGDSTFATIRIDHKDVVLQPVAPGQIGAPVTLSLDGLATLDLVFSESTGGLSRVVSTPRLVRGSQPVDPAVTAAITTTRALEYPGLDQLLVAPQGVAPMTQTAWEQLVCEGVRGATEADTVFLGPLDPVSNLPGPISELRLVDQLAGVGELRSHRVTGSQFSAVLDRSFGAVAVSCGATANHKRARGRAIDSDRTYRVVSAANGVSRSDIDAIVGSAVVKGYWGEEQPVAMGTAHANVLHMLRDVRDQRGGPQGVNDWLFGAPNAMPEMWLLKLRQFDLSLVRFRGTQKTAFESVPETLANSPSSLTVGTGLDVALDYSSSSILADARFRSEFVALTVDDESLSETADDWRLSSATAVPSLRIPSTGLMPYTEVLYDSEYTATQDPDGGLNPVQSDLSLTLGLSSRPWGFLRLVRFGGFGNKDVARWTQKATEYGGKLEWEGLATVGRRVRWSTHGDVVVYADTPDDDASDLRFRAFGESRLSVPLVGHLNLDVYAQGFGLQGRVQDNDELGLSWTVGAAMDMRGVFEL